MTPAVLYAYHVLETLVGIPRAAFDLGVFQQPPQPACDPRCGKCGSTTFHASSCPRGQQLLS